MRRLLSNECVRSDFERRSPSTAKILVRPADTTFEMSGAGPLHSRRSGRPRDRAATNRYRRVSDATDGVRPNLVSKGEVPYDACSNENQRE
jgi:hypothetical protein